MVRKILQRRALRMAGKAIRNPTRAVLRLVLKTRLRRTPIDQERPRLLGVLSRRFGVDATGLLADYRRSEFREWFQERRAALDRFDGPYRFGTTGEFGCEAMYLLVRALRPQVVVETGVLYGASSAHILAALAHNGGGELHSIDIGRDPREPRHDHFVPIELRPNWDLIIGDSRHELPPLLRRCGSIDMFHHDSLHTREHMTWEYQAAFPYLSADGVLSSDDIQNPPSLAGIFQENAFPAFCRDWRVPFATFHNLGVAFRGTGRSAAVPIPLRDELDAEPSATGWAGSRSWGISPNGNLARDSW